MRRPILLMAALLSISLCAGAQNVVPMPKETGGGASVNRGLERAGTVSMPDQMKLPPVEYTPDFDAQAKKMEDMMAERSWSSEDTAWEKACGINTKESYQRYIALYPYGAHRPEASQRLIDIQVDDILNGDHGNLPKMDRVSEDDDSPTSTITIENDTGYPLTVMYSGVESRSIVIGTGSKGTVTLPNGQYRIAASVPAANIHPFAGNESFIGGRYEVGFIIAPTTVRRGMGPIYF